MGGDDGERFSVELCGGTHVRRTGDIGFFKIVSEGAVAAGVRRIEAVTGRAAQDYISETDKVLQEASQALGVRPAELPVRIAALLEERRKLENELSAMRRRMATGAGADGAAGAGTKDVAGIRFAARDLENVPARELKSLADELKMQVGSGVVAVAASADGKASLVVAVTPDLTDRIDAVKLVRIGADVLGGKGGGGRPDMAQAGGPDGSRTGAALAAIERALEDAAAAAA
jgi:alanyl-tRNA synthetase